MKIKTVVNTREEAIRKIQSDIGVVADRHGITHWAFCGEHKDRVFVGFLQGGKVSQGAAMLVILNVGRLWQHARQTCRELLDSYERLP